MWLSFPGSKLKSITVEQGEQESLLKTLSQLALFSAVPLRCSKMIVKTTARVWKQQRELQAPIVPLPLGSHHL